MAAVLSPTRYLLNPAFPAASSSAASVPCCSRFQNSGCLSNHVAGAFVRFHRPFLPYPRPRPGLCLAASPGPREPGPPPEDDPVGLKGVGSSLSKLQNTLQIFFAVLFWMSLFFWASAWDGRNRPGKGPGFRK